MEKGIEKGGKEKEIQITKNCIQAGFPNETIHSLTGLPLDEIQKIREGI
jgi:hypothetical protein